jgi:cupin fold WbuC family metalloprotein
MKEIRSEDGKLLHMVHRIEDSKEQRKDLVPEDQYIQCSFLNMKEGTTFRPHQHIWKQPIFNKVIAQESWIVVKGSVLCHFYDTEGNLLEEVQLNAGDASFTLEGGHNYTILEDNTLVYEYKTGPYEGQSRDKVFL